MKVLMIGDIVGSCGLEYLKKTLPALRRREQFDLVIANGENVAEHNGITEAQYRELLFAGVDVVTMGNHIWSERNITQWIDRAEALARPANYPNNTPGKGYVIADLGRRRVAVVNVMGNLYLSNLSSPFLMMHELVAEIQALGIHHIIVDVHAEATSEKMALGYALDGTVSAVIGTHTHVQTADERILPKGTGYITDVGMTGAIESILGVTPRSSVQMFQTQMPGKLEQATGDAHMDAVVLALDDDTGKCKTITRF